MFAILEVLLESLKITVQPTKVWIWRKDEICFMVMSNW